MSNSGSKMILAGIAGLAAGVAIGLLFAPTKGSKTRKRLKKKLMSLADTIGDDVTDKLGALKSVFSVEEDDETDDDDEEDLMLVNEAVKQKNSATQEAKS